ncbi:MAG: OpgC domain-containing protein [Candidatus Competibacteraceae bacterium]|nr:OpgC domain-containing protein [Candidatus Competibacteraceae bacterium]
MQRLLEIDILRGILLLVMVINHTPSPLRGITTQPLGFVSAAEVFIFVSAFLCGLIFSRRLPSGGVVELKRLARRRIRQVYIAHLLTLLFCFAVIGQLLGHQAPFYNMVHSYLQRPAAAAFSALFLLYQPPLLDILPMYLVFLWFTPQIMGMAARVGWWWVAAISLLLWLAAQYGLKQWIASTLTGSWLVVDLGAFNLFAWQLLWISGLFLGHCFQQNRGNCTLVLTKTIWSIPAGLAIFFFCWRWSWIPISSNLGGHNWLLDKWSLGPLRVLNFFALLYLVLWLKPVLAKAIRWLKPLAVLGRNLLPLFCLHVGFALLAVGFITLYNLPNHWCYLILALHLALITCASLLLDRVSNPLISGNTPMPPLHG